MNNRDFCYWLRGYFELTGSDNLTEEQVKEIKKHLDMVFNQEPYYSTIPTLKAEDVNLVFAHYGS